MYAIVEIAGQQYKVEKDQQIFVHRLEGKEGSKVSFDKVLLTNDGKKVEVGAPAVKGVAVSAKIVEHLKGDKVIVFKKKRRKGYKVKNGHRQAFSKIQIEGIGAAPKAAAAKTETKTEAKAEKTEAKAATTEKKSTAKASTATKKAAPKAKATTAKKAAPKKAATKTTAAKKSSTKDKKEDK